MRRQLEIEATEPAPPSDLFTKEREPTILDYVQVVWSGRWLVLALVAVATTGALGLSVVMPKTYTAQATLLPLGTDRAMGLGALSGALGGGLSGTLAMESPGMKLMAVLQSRTVAESVVSNLDLVSVLGRGKEPRPTRAEVVEMFRKRVLSVKNDRGVIVVTARWRDADVTAAIANAAVSATAGFLNEHSISTSFQIVDDAVPPEKPSSPKILLNTVLAFVLSAFAAVFLVFVRHYVNGLRAAHVPAGASPLDVPRNGSAAG